MTDTTAPMATLANLRSEMQAKGMSPAKLARMVPPGFKGDRIADLASRNDARRPEPWLWEAYYLARVLGTNDIATLIGVPIEELGLQEDGHDPVDTWRTGCELTLSIAVRLCLKLGIPDPYTLFELHRVRTHLPLVTGLWNMPPLSGPCQWCGNTTGDHFDTCQLDILWGPRDRSVDTIVDAPRPRKPGVRQNGFGRKAPGLKWLRKRLGKTQEVMAVEIGVSLAHWCKMETKVANLTPENAQIIMRLYPDVTMVSLFTEPTPDEIKAINAIAESVRSPDQIEAGA